MAYPKRELYALFSRRITDQTEYHLAMTAHVEKTEKGYVIPLTAEMVTELGLTAGASVEVRRANGVEQSVAGEEIAVEEALRLYQQSKTRFGAAYEALAK